MIPIISSKYITAGKHCYPNRSKRPTGVISFNPLRYRNWLFNTVMRGVKVAKRKEHPSALWRKILLISICEAIMIKKQPQWYFYITVLLTVCKNERIGKTFYLLMTYHQLVNSPLALLRAYSSVELSLVGFFRIG